MSKSNVDKKKDKEVYIVISGQDQKSCDKSRSFLNELNPVLKEVLLGSLSIAAIAGSIYVAYKVGEKIGLNSEIKKILSRINSAKCGEVLGRYVIVI